MRGSRNFCSRGGGGGGEARLTGKSSDFLIRFFLSPRGLVFKQLSRTRQMLMHEKTCVIPMFSNISGGRAVKHFQGVATFSWGGVHLLISINL